MSFAAALHASCTLYHREACQPLACQLIVAASLRGVGSLSSAAVTTQVSTRIEFSFIGRTMKREDRRQHRVLMAIAALAVVTLAVGLTLFLAEDRADLILRGSTVSAADQNSFKLSQPIEIMAEPRVVVTRGTVSMAQPQGAAPLGSRAVATLLASGKSVLILRDAQLVVGAQSDGNATSTVRIDAPLAKALATTNYSALIIDDGRIEVAADKGTAAVLHDVHLRLRRAAGDRVIAKGSVKLLGRKLKFDSTVGARKGDFEAQQLPIRGSITAGSLLNASFSGLFALGDGGRLIADTSHLEVSDVPVFARWLGLSWPSALGLKTFVSDGKLEWVRQIVNFHNGRFQLDGNTAAGSLLVNGKGERPLIDGTLAFDKLDLGALLTPDPKSGSLLAKTVRGTAHWLPDSIRNMLHEISLPILNELDVDLRISSQQTVFTSFSVNRTAAALSLREGRVLLDLAEMELPAGGQGSLLLSVDPSSGVTKCGLRGKLKGVRIENISDIVFPHPVLSGPADVKIDLSGDWIDAESFVRSLDGRVGMQMVSGATLDADLPGLVTSMGVNEPPVEGWGPAKSGRTDLETLSAEIALSNGHAQIERLVTERQGLREMAVTGSVNLHRKMLDLNVFPRAASNGTNGESGEVPSVLNINGSWEKPNVVKRPFPNKAENPVYLESQDSGSDPKDSSAPVATRG